LLQLHKFENYILQYDFISAIYHIFNRFASKPETLVSYTGKDYLEYRVSDKVSFFIIIIMDSRTRVLNAINQRETDRVPVDFGGHRSSGIMAIAYSRLKDALGIHSGDIYVYDMIQQLAIVEPEILELFSVDTIEMGRGFMHQDSDWKDWILPDGTPCKIPVFIELEKEGDDWYLLSDEGMRLGVQKKGCLYFEQLNYPMKDVDFNNDDFSNLEEYFSQSMWNTIGSPGAHLPSDEKGLTELRQGAAMLRDSTDKAIIGLFGGNLFEVPQFLFGPEQYFMYLSLYPEAVIRLSEQLTALYLNKLENWLGAVGDHIDIILFGDDLGSNLGPLISPEMYRRYYKPYHKALWARAKELADVKVQLHCCGGVEPLLEDLIEAGLDAINPVQISARAMDPSHLKSVFGGRLCFWGGGCDTQNILPQGTPQEVYDHTRSMLQAWGNEGGFVFQAVHNIMADVPVENILAMFRAVSDH